MALLDMVMGLASSQSDKIARVLGKDPAQVKSAVSNAAKLLPKILSAKDNGAGILRELGVDNGFVQDMYNKYSPYASKIGLSDSAVKNAVDTIGRGIGQESQPRRPGFNLDKYPKI